jgi:hypothetical protein
VLAEQLALGGEFADEGDEVSVVRVASCFEPEHGGGVGGYAVVVDAELSGAGSRYVNLVVLAARLAVAPATGESRTGE